MVNSTRPTRGSINSRTGAVTVSMAHQNRMGEWYYPTMNSPWIVQGELLSLEDALVVADSVKGALLVSDSVEDAIDIVVSITPEGIYYTHILDTLKAMVKGPKTINVNINQKFEIMGMVYRVKQFITANHGTPKASTNIVLVQDQKADQQITIPALSFAESIKTGFDVKPLNKFIYVEWPMGDARCWCAYDQDFDTEFQVFSFYYAQKFVVHGWNCEITPINDGLTLTLEV